MNYRWDLRSSGILRRVDWLLVAGVSGQRICPIVKGPAVPETSVTTNLRCETSQKSQGVIYTRRKPETMNYRCCYHFPALEFI